MKKILLTLLVIACTTLSAQVTITMEQEAGVYKVPCVVNGAKMKFIFDTGAATVCLSESMAEYLLDNDYISKDDFIGTGSSTVADGRTVSHLKIILRDIEIAGLHLKDVEASVVEGQRAPLLLGQTAIQKLGKVSIDGNKLIIENGGETCYINNLHIRNITFSDLKGFAEGMPQYQDGWYPYVLAEVYRMGDCVSIDFKSAVYWYRIASENGNLDATCSLGDCYYWGYGVEQNYTTAMYWYEQAAIKNHASALYSMGWCYGHGQGVSENIDKGFDYTVKATKSNVGTYSKNANRNANEELKNYYNRYYNIATNNGNGVACFHLALCYDLGYGTSIDKLEALKWYKKGAEQGNYASMNNIAVLYERGEGGIKKDIITAMYWYKQAAKEDVMAQRNLGKRYFYATSEVKQDLVESLYWFKHAADNGDFVSQKWVADFYHYGWGIEKNSSYALEKYTNLYQSLSKILNLPSEQKDERLLTYNQVCCTLGHMYGLGDGCEKSNETAIQWYLACLDYGEAYYFLYLYYETGTGVTKDTYKALQQLLNNRTAQWKDAKGLNALAYKYAEGTLGLSKSLSMAHEVIDEAMELEPNNPDYYDSKGEFYSMQGKYKEAKEMWLKVKALDATYYTKNNTGLNKYIQKHIK